MYWNSLLFPLLAVPACQALPSLQKRASDPSNATLFAYGTNISGFPVLYAPKTSELYVAHATSPVDGLERIIWDIPPQTMAGNLTTNGTLSNGTSVGSMLIDPTNMYDEVLVSKRGTVGFSVYGKQLVYFNGSNIQSEFWAKEVAQSDGTTVWVLHWNSNNEFRTGAVPVGLKIISPA